MGEKVFVLCAQSLPLPTNTGLDSGTLQFFPSHFPSSSSGMLKGIPGWEIYGCVCEGAYAVCRPCRGPHDLPTKV